MSVLRRHLKGNYVDHADGQTRYTYIDHDVVFRRLPGKPALGQDFLYEVSVAGIVVGILERGTVEQSRTENLLRYERKPKVQFRVVEEARHRIWHDTLEEAARPLVGAAIGRGEVPPGPPSSPPA